jgi:hypothetical protein
MLVTLCLSDVFSRLVSVKKRNRAGFALGRRSRRGVIAANEAASSSSGLQNLFETGRFYVRQSIRIRKDGPAICAYMNVHDLSLWFIGSRRAAELER